MNKQRTHRLFSHFFLMLFVAVLSASTLHAQEFTGDPVNGKTLFNGQCAACHKLDKKVIGPALGKVTERRTTEWLYAWIKDNQALRESGDADAIAIYEEYDRLSGSFE
jgi:cytochrome c2